MPKTVSKKRLTRPPTPYSAADKKASADSRAPAKTIEPESSLRIPASEEYTSPSFIAGHPDLLGYFSHLKSLHEHQINLRETQAVTLETQVKTYQNKLTNQAQKYSEDLRNLQRDLQESSELKVQELRETIQNLEGELTTCKRQKQEKEQTLDEATNLLQELENDNKVTKRDAEEISKRYQLLLQLNSSTPWLLNTIGVLSEFLPVCIHCEKRIYDKTPVHHHREYPARAQESCTSYYHEECLNKKLTQLDSKCPGCQDTLYKKVTISPWWKFWSKQTTDSKVTHSPDPNLARHYVELGNIIKNNSSMETALFEKNNHHMNKIREDLLKSSESQE